MTVYVVLVDPPLESVVRETFIESTDMPMSFLTDLYQAIQQDAIQAVIDSGGDLLINYRPPDQHPVADDHDIESTIRSMAEAVDGCEDPRMEIQVGSNRSARIGNAITHLLETEDHETVAVLDGRAPLLRRTELDSLAMKLRRHDIIIGPGTNCEVAIAGFRDTIDFTHAFQPPALNSLVEQSVEDGYEIDFLHETIYLTDKADLLDLIPIITARQQAGRIVPPHTTAVIDAYDLSISVENDTLHLEIQTDKS
ncbi:MAG: hypothetical protein ABEI06_09985 [Halobacteriaceae archaeon]